METIIIMTEVNSYWGRYVKFTKKGSNEIIAEVDRKKKFDFGWAGYVVYGGGMIRSEIARRTNKGSAIKYAQDYITGFIPDAKFKWNVMCERIKYN